MRFWEKLLRQGRLEESIPSHPPLTGKKMGLSWAAWGTMEVPRWPEKRLGMCGVQPVTHVRQAGYLPTQPEAPRKESNQKGKKSRLGKNDAHPTFPEGRTPCQTGLQARTAIPGFRGVRNTEPHVCLSSTLPTALHTQPQL